MKVFIFLLSSAPEMVSGLHVWTANKQTLPGNGVCVFLGRCQPSTCCLGDPLRGSVPPGPGAGGEATRNPTAADLEGAVGA